MLHGVQGHQDAGLLLHDAHQQVVDVLLQLRDLVVPLSQLALELLQQQHQLSSGELGERALGLSLLHLDARQVTMSTAHLRVTHDHAECVNNLEIRC